MTRSTAGWKIRFPPPTRFPSPSRRRARTINAAAKPRTPPYNTDFTTVSPRYAEQGVTPAGKIVEYFLKRTTGGTR